MKILIAVDDKQHGNAMIDFIIKSNWSTITDIKLLHIVEPLLVDSYMSMIPSPILGEAVDQEKKMAQELLSSMESKLKPAFSNVKIEKSIIEDFPKSAILEEAKKWNADLIMMGSHGRKGFNKFILGSVSQAVSAHAEISVLIIRSKN